MFNGWSFEIFPPIQHPSRGCSGTADKNPTKMEQGLNSVSGPMFFEDCHCRNISLTQNILSSIKNCRVLIIFLPPCSDTVEIFGYSTWAF